MNEEPTMTHTPRTLRLTVLIGAAFLLGSCQGMISDKPPIHPNQNMDVQDRFNAQEQNAFFADGRAMRTPVQGTVARGGLRQDTELYEGLDARGQLVSEIPVPVTRDLVYRGKDRYDIYCAPCHGGTGDGQGIIMTGQYGYVPAPSFHSDYIREQPDGHFYSSIANGIRSMPSYATQIKVEDRWAIVSYIRALQKSQNVNETEILRYDVDLAALREDYDREQARLAALEEARKAAAQAVRSRPHLDSRSSHETPAAPATPSTARRSSAPRCSDSTARTARSTTAHPPPPTMTTFTPPS